MRKIIVHELSKEGAKLQITSNYSHTDIKVIGKVEELKAPHDDILGVYEVEVD